MKITFRCEILYLILLAVLTVPVHAAIITVNAPNGDYSAADNLCSINEAIDAANRGGLANNNCNSGSAGSDTIVLTVNVVIENTSGALIANNPSPNGSNGTASISSPISIEGNGFKLSSANTCTPDNTNAAGEFRLLHVGATGNLVIKDLILENGCANGNDASDQDIDNGGAIYNLGNLIVHNSTITSNKAWNEGGGIYNASSANIIISNSVLSDNSATENGGGLSNIGNTMISYSTFSGNTAGTTTGGNGFGGAIYHNNGQVGSITATTFSDNSAVSFASSSEGGALYVNSSITEISNSTFSGNSVENDSGGAVGNGAAISLESGTITTIKNTTFSANTSASDGGISNTGGSITNYYNNIVEAENPPVHCASFGWGAVNASNNLDDGTCPGASGTEVTNFDTMLKDNGGPTETHALQENSNAINAGNDSVCPQTDQRGWLRRDDDCDIGAFEFGALRPGTGGQGKNLLLLLSE